MLSMFTFTVVVCFRCTHAQLQALRAVAEAKMRVEGAYAGLAHKQPRRAPSSGVPVFSILLKYLLYVGSWTLKGISGTVRTFVVSSSTELHPFSLQLLVGRTSGYVPRQVVQGMRQPVAGAPAPDQPNSVSDRGAENGTALRHAQRLLRLPR